MGNILTPHQQAALDYSRHISLTANAGSGKTFVLSKRYLQIVLNENVPLRNIAAITFTDKAAGELYKKISGEIDKLVTETNDDLLLKKLEKVRRQLVSANISTIHSFCIDILREYPVEAELDANFISIDQNLSDELLELAVEEIIKESLLSPEQSENLKTLIRHFSSKLKLSTEISSLVRNRKNVLEAARHYTDSPPETAAFFNKAFIEEAKVYLSPGIKTLLDNLTIINNEVLSRKKDNSLALELKYLLDKLQGQEISDTFLINLKIYNDKLLTTGNKIRSAGYLRNEARKGLTDIICQVEIYLYEIQCFLITPEHEKINYELAVTGSIILKFFNECLARYELKKKEEGYLDYEDLLLHTKRILENPQVQESLSSKFKYIMVDEYQDTNEIQYKIFLPILDYLKKNNLFVVGDEKQSIYMFRDAEIEVFNKTKDDIIKVSGETSQLTLPDSFRMAPALCAFTNTLFSSLFADPVSGFNEVAHSEIICARTEEGEGSVEILTVEKENKDYEAELTARRFIQIVEEEKTYKWGDIAVLCRKRKSFEDLEQAFIKYSIPYSILGGKGFYQRQTVYDVYNYFAFLLDQKNDASLAGILRSPFFNISDSVLYEISLMPGSSFWSKLNNYSLQNPEAAAIKKLIEKNLQLAGNYNLNFLLRKILNDTGYNAVIASGVNGEQETANINKLIRLTAGFFSHGFKTLYDYVNFLKDSIKTEEDEAQAAVSDESDSVKIMTIHQAKGLEYPVVLLYKSNETSKKSTNVSKEISVDKKYGLLTKVPLNGDYFRGYEAAPILNLSSYKNEKKNLAEIKRLFYVAVTRAKDKLIISTVIPDRQKNDSFTGLLQKGLDINLTLPEFNLNSSLKYLIKNENGFTQGEKTIELTIPVIKDIKEPDIQDKKNDKEIKNFVTDISVIGDIQQGEIISATKYALFKQCPVKYNLIYEYGFSELYNHKIRNDDGEAVIDDEEDIDPEVAFSLSKYADTKGMIIHKILQQEILPDKLAIEGVNVITDGLKGINISEKEKNALCGQILADVGAYFKSKIYEKVKNYTSFYNEYNIYLKQDDYFLYGIIDKLVIDGDRAVIIDYKTDDIPQKSIPERSAKYFNQLKFYSYIIKSAFKNLLQIELRLVYLKCPEEDISIMIAPGEIKQTGEDISRMVKEIRAKDYVKNYDHCRSCHFFINNSGCIII